jgi:hypothetical protein
MAVAIHRNPRPGSDALSQADRLGTDIDPAGEDCGFDCVRCIPNDPHAVPFEFIPRERKRGGTELEDPGRDLVGDNGHADRLKCGAHVPGIPSAVRRVDDRNPGRGRLKDLRRRGWHGIPPDAQI